MREAVVDAKVAVAEIQEAIARTEREVGLERQRLADAERRGRLAGEIQDQETVTVAERFAAKHRERLGVLERKLATQREELALAQRELDEMQTQLKRAERDRPAMEAQRSAQEAAAGTEPGLDLQDELLKRGATAPEAMRIIMGGDPQPSQRQVGMVDAHGNAASWTGDSTFDWAGGRTGGGGVGGKGQMITGHGYAAQANIMVSDATVRNMAETFEHARGSLADRLIAALVAGQAGGGEKRGMQSAALLVVRAKGGYLGGTDRYIDIRVYDAPAPIKELQRLYALHKLYFFTSDSADLTPITPALQKELEAILLTEPANQPQKWLAAPQPSLNQTFLTALANFMYWENYDVRVRMDGKIDRVALDDIRKNRRPRR